MTESQSQSSSWLVRQAGPALGVLLVAGSLLWAADLYRWLGLSLFPEQIFAAALGIAIAAVMIIKPVRGTERDSVPWYDLVAAAVAVVAGLYVAIRYPEMLDELHGRPLDAIVAGSVFILLSIEGLRRTIGGVLVLVVLFFIGFGLLGHLIPGELQGHRASVDRMIVYLGIDANAILGIPMRAVTTIVVPFVLFGFFLTRSGGATFFTELSIALMGHRRGGSAKIAITASALFGSISGSAVSNVVTTGVITIPMMQKGGFRPHTAGAIEAVASTGGQLMPPIMGAAAFLMAEILAVPYGDVLLAALIPSLLYYVALFIQIDLIAARDGIAPVERSKIPRLVAVLRGGWVFSLPFVAIFFALFWMNWGPETAALIASAIVVGAGLFVGYKSERMTLADAGRAIRETGLAVLDIFMIAAAAGIIIGVMNLSGLGFGLTLALVKFAQGDVFLLLFMAALVCILLGMGMPTLGVYVLLATLVAPALVRLGVQPMAAHLFVLYFGMMSMITPPVAIAAFAAAVLAKSRPMLTALESCKLGWTAYIVPFVFVLAPHLILKGDALPVILATVTAIAGVWLASIGVIGYLARPLDWIARAALVLSGLALLVPSAAVEFGLWTDIGGAVVAVIAIGRELICAPPLFVTRVLRPRNSA